MPTSVGASCCVVIALLRLSDCQLPSCAERWEQLQPRHCIIAAQVSTGLSAQRNMCRSRTFGGSLGRHEGVSGFFKGIESKLLQTVLNSAFIFLICTSPSCGVFMSVRRATASCIPLSISQTRSSFCTFARRCRPQGATHRTC